MTTDTYYRDHWVDIDEDRLDSYQGMFKWHPAMEPLIAAAEIEAGNVVVDYGCGPGGLGLELARRIGESGHLHGVDLNAEFVEIARKNMAGNGFGDYTTIHHVSDDDIPLGDGVADRLVCKNVLEYVTNPTTVIAEFNRVLKPGGIAHIIDSDWGMVVVEPLGYEKLAELFSYARCAYHTPHIGRILYSEMKNAGFRTAKVKILSSADTKGRMLPIMVNMVNYAKIGGMDPARADAMLDEIKASIEDGTFMLVLPQFLVTATK